MLSGNEINDNLTIQNPLGIWIFRFPVSRYPRDLEKSGKYREFFTFAPNRGNSRITMISVQNQKGHKFKAIDYMDYVDYVDHGDYVDYIDYVGHVDHIYHIEHIGYIGYIDYMGYMDI